MRHPIVRSALHASVAAYAMVAAAPSLAQARTFDLPRQPAASGIPEFARQANIQILVSEAAVRGKTTMALNGAMSTKVALQRLLAGTGLRIKSTDGRTFILSANAASSGNGRNAQADTAASAETIAAPNDGPDQAAEIVVTATRMSEAASRVPVSLSVYNQQALDARGIRSMEDAAQMTPGVAFAPTGFGAQTELSIRGVRSDVGAATVGVYVDDTPIQAAGLGFGNQNAYPKMFDLERVEVLRGPQGTLFGSSSQGGTIRFITPAPGLQDWTGYARGEVSDTSRGAMNYEIGAAVGGPVVTDKIGIRVSAYYRRDGGYVDRVPFPGATLAKRNSNSADSYVVRGAVTFAPSDEIRATAAILYQNTRQNDTSNIWALISDREKGDFKSGQRIPTIDRDKFVLPSLKVEYNGPGFDVISNTSYFWRRNNPSLDYSDVVTGIFAGLPYIPELPNYEAMANLQNKYDSFTQELRFQSPSDARLRWAFGLYYNHLKQKAGEQIIDENFGDLIQYQFGGSLEEITGMGLIDGRFSYLQDFKATTEEISAFGDINYELIQGVRVSVGARVSRNSFRTDNFVTGPFNFGSLRSGASGKESPISPKFGVNWQIDPRNMIYATAAKGYRMGGGNVVFDSPACANDLALRGYLAVPQTYGSDSLWSYELGTKNRLFGSLQLAASVFQINWKGIQQSVQLSNCGLQFTDNLGKAKSEGFDVELNQKIGQSFLLSAQLGYTNSRYTKTLAISADPDTLPIVRAGNALQQQPWTITVSGQYDFALLQENGYLRVDYTRLAGHRDTASQDRGTASYDPSRLARQGYTMLNARLGAKISGWDMSLFANNILNQHPRLFSFGQSTSEAATIYRKETTLRPRVVGLTAAYRY